MTNPAFQPLYLQIKQTLLQNLHALEWKPGQSIPSEMELATRFNVSQGTVRKAVDELAAENLLVRRQGKGTFVATHTTQHIPYRFLRLVPDNAGEPEKESERNILSCKCKKTNAEIAKALQLKTSARVVQIVRTLTFGTKTAILEHIWLPEKPFFGLDIKRLRDNQGPLYALFESEFGVNMVRAQERLKAVLADAAQAQALNITPQSPLLQIERVTYTYHDTPMEVRLAWYDTSAHHYANTLQ